MISVQECELMNIIDRDQRIEELEKERDSYREAYEILREQVGFLNKHYANGESKTARLALKQAEEIMEKLK